MNKKILFLLCLILFIVSIACVSAVDDANQTVNEDTLALSQEVNDDVLCANMGTYSDLVKELGSGGNFTLTKDIYSYDSGCIINITQPRVIDGNDAIIDMTNSRIDRIFNIESNDVTIKNMIFKNVDYVDYNDWGDDTDDKSMDNLQTSEENNEMALNDNDESMGSQTVTEVLCVGDNSIYSELSHEISQSGSIKLKYKNYIYDEGATAITIEENNKVIDGNGAVIDMKGSTVRAFYVSASGVIIKNLTIKNAKNVNGGSIYFSSSGEVTNCNFTNNYASSAGGAISFRGEGTVTNCNFIENTADLGGAISFDGEGTVSNCNFTNNQATFYGGAVYFSSSGEVTNCNFNDNTARDYGGGAISFDGEGTVSNCNFTNNKVNQANGRESYGGAVYFYRKGTVTNCNFINNQAKGRERSYGGAVYMTSGSGDVTNCNFIKNTANLGGAIYWMGDNGLLQYSIFKSNTASTGGAVYWSGDNGKMQYCKYYTKDSSKGNDMYSSGSNFRLIEYPVLIDVPDVTKNYGGSERLEITLTDSGSPIANADVNIKINGQTYVRTTDSNGKASLGLNLNAGSYDAAVSYKDISTTAKVIINKLTTKDTLSYSKNSHNSVTLTALIDPSSASGDVVFTVNGKDYPAVINGGKATYTLNNLAVGQYSAVANYKGDVNHKGSASNSVKFAVEDVKIDVIAPDLTKYFKGSERFVVTVKEDNAPVVGRDVAITINGQTYTRTTDNNGVASMAINLDSGKYDVTAEYGGIKAHSTVTVNPTIVANDFTKIFRNDTQYYGKFTDSQGNPLKNTDVKFNINGVFYTRTTDDQGVAKMNINLNPGSYVLTATNPTNGEMQSVTITVLTSIVENYDLTKYYKNDSQYRIRLLDGQGNPIGAGVSIEFNINGVFYTRTSDAQGYVKMNINLNPGTYIITANYNGLMASNTITVKPILEAEDLVMSYGDGSKFNTTLLDGQGKPLANKTITFNINGVFYDRTTDENGVAHLNINLMAGEYIITSMYENGAATSNRVTIRS